MSGLFQPAANAILTNWPGPDGLIDWAIRHVPGPDVLIGFLVLVTEAAFLFLVAVAIWKIGRHLSGKRPGKSGNNEV